jgi:hypothetical protein
MMIVRDRCFRNFANELKELLMGEIQSPTFGRSGFGAALTEDPGALFDGAYRLGPAWTETPPILWNKIIFSRI